MLQPDHAAGHRFRILWAEDDDALLNVAAEALRAHGYIVECAPDGERALSDLRHDREGFDLLITDFEMPRVDGLALVSRSRAAGYRGRVIVFASALPPKVRGGFDDLAVDAIVEKPSRQRELIATVKRLEGECGIAAAD